MLATATLFLCRSEGSYSSDRVEGISASSTRVALALACGCILAVTRTGVLSPGRARAVVPPGGDASGSAAAAGRDQVAGGQPGGPAGGLHGDLEQQPRRLVFPGRRDAGA
jgi:hypothetical protein